VYRFVAARFSALLATLAVVSIIIFLFVRLLPGNILDLFFAGDTSATPQELAQAKTELGLNGSYPEQYWRWISGVFQGNFGKSLLSQQPVSTIMATAIPIDIELVILALLFALAIVMRMVRATMLEVLGQDYVRTARAKGARRHTVLRKHALRNALIPVLTVVGFEIGGLIGGAALAEIIYGLPGVGYQLLHGILERDYPVVEASTLIIAGTFVVVSFAVDILYGVLDPRITVT